jgi:Tetratricopeptide repeat
MKRAIQFVLVAGCCWALSLPLAAQTPASGDAASTQQQKSAQKPDAKTAKPASTQTESNPFPTDTSLVPVVPSLSSVAAPAPDAADYANVPLPGEDSDPVRSPDDGGPTTASGSQGGFSDSNQGMADLLKPPPDARKQKGEAIETIPQPTPKQDESVGSYYLQTKDWKGALSRFESALVLDPENPEVYWGLAEAQRHLGDYADAKANYLKVMEYDPDSHHSKDAKKILQQPEMESAPAVSVNSHTAKPQQ